MSTNVTKLPRSGRQSAAQGVGGLHDVIEAARRAQRRAAMVASGASIAWVLLALVYVASNGSDGKLARLALPEIAMLVVFAATAVPSGEYWEIPA